MLGFHPGRRHALMAGLVEAGGGLLLAVGFLTPVAAALVFSLMLVAAGSAHVKQGFFVHNGGYEYTLVLGVAGLAAAFTGPGTLSLDALFGSSVSVALWGVAALFVGLVGGAFQLAQRRPALTPQPVYARSNRAGPVATCIRDGGHHVETPSDRSCRHGSSARAGFLGPGHLAAQVVSPDDFGLSLRSKSRTLPTDSPSRACGVCLRMAPSWRAARLAMV